MEVVQQDDENMSMVLQDLRRFLSTGSALDDKAAMAMPVAAIKSLLGVVQRSTAHTMMGLQDELKVASEEMMAYADKNVKNRSHIALSSGCELFLKYITRAFLESPSFEDCRQHVLERGERFAGISLAARDRIAKVGADFVQDGRAVLVHGWSRVVASLLTRAARTKHIRVICLEGRPDAAGVKAANFYAEAGIPTTVVLDSAMGYIMESVDMVLVGAEGVVENGGIVNKLGTYGLAICAKEHGTPFYVAAESYKFARLYPLHQRDLPKNVGDTGIPSHIELSTKVEIDNPACDYTPAKFITLLFTDLGVLTPSAVSDELIRLYQ